MSDDDTVHEIFDAQIPRVDAVDGPAHGRPFLILKADALDPLVELARVLKAKYTAAEQRRMLANGRAMKGPDGEPSYPIGDRDDLEAAVRAVGRGSADHSKIRRYIARRAEALGVTDLIPPDWAPDGTIKKASGMDDDAVTALTDPGVIDSKDVVPDAGGVVAPTFEGDPDEVGTPAWEAVDAARARAATQAVTWLQGLVGDMRDREATEAMTVDPDDAQSAMDLDGVLDALDCALTVLARFAVTEQSEADTLAQQVEDQAEALGLVKAIETAVGEVTKAGRVLSSANEASLRSAHAALTEVLGRVPAPATEEAPVAAPTEAVAKAANVAAEDATDEVGVEKSIADDVAPDVDVNKTLADDVAPDVDVNKATGTGVGHGSTEDPAAASMTVPGESRDSDTMTGTDSEDVPVIAKAAGMDVDTLRAMLMKLVRALPDGEVTAAFQSMAGAVNPTADADADPAADAPADAATDAAMDTAPEVPAAPAVADPAATDPAQAAGMVDDEGNVTKSMRVEDLAAVLKAAVIAPLEERTRDSQDAQTEKFAKQLAAVLTPMLEQQEALPKRLELIEAQPVPGPLLNGHTPGADGLAMRGQAYGPVDGLAGVQKALRELAAVNPHQAEAAKGVLALGAITDILRGTQSR